jgi:hypothetical protein
VPIPAAFRSVTRLAAAAVVILAVIAVGAIALGSRGGPGPAAPPSPSPAPIATPSAAPSSAAPSPAASQPAQSPAASSAAQAAIAALDLVDKGITAARGPVGLTVDDQSRLFQLEDDARGRLERGDVVTARQPFDQMVAYLATMGSKLDSDGGRRLQAAMAALDLLLPKG